MTDSDFRAFMKVFKYYFEHLGKYPDSLLARIYGVYQVDMEMQDPVFLILMGNTKKIDNKYIRKVYDLKGSMIKREVKAKEKPTIFEGNFKNTDCLKDLNLKNLLKELVALKFSKNDKDEILEKLRKDVTLLSQFNLMDYSLLFVIAFNPNYVNEYPEHFEADENHIHVTPYKLKK